nr:hypothetical protein [Xanthomonas maliensis]
MRRFASCMLAMALVLSTVAAAQINTLPSPSAPPSRPAPAGGVKAVGESLPTGTITYTETSMRSC